jgi:hypothetical protein
MSEAGAQSPLLRRFLWAGTISGGAGALVNAVYFVGYRAATAYAGAEPTVGSTIVASLLPPVLAGLGYWLLSRFTRHATPIFVALTWAITLATFESLLHETLSDGSLKPAGFDALVLPMHVVVGGLAALIIPRLAWRRTDPARRERNAGA